MSEEALSLIPPGKVRCVVTGLLRNDTPEEHVRQRIARSLMDDYGYASQYMEVEFPISVGSSRKRVDIAIFLADKPHLQEHIFIIIECKRESIRPTDHDNGIEQLHSYLASCLNARYGMWVGSELQVCEKVADTTGHYSFDAVTDIPRFGADAPHPITFTDLVPAQEELKAVFHRCHNYIHGNQGLQKEPAFQELLKIIFCKVYDEDNTFSGPMRFFISNDERRSDIGQRKLRVEMERLFEDVKQRYPYIFAPDEIIRLENRVLSYIVGEMQRFSLIQTKADIKGEAYERLVGANLRGDRGEYFTPRNVCEMAAQMVLATYPTDQWLHLEIIDPACGTGGFLVSMMNVWRTFVYEQLLARYRGDETRAVNETNTKIRDIASRHLVGIDFNPVLVRAAQMNLVMHGDGSTNVFHANALLHPGEWSDTPPNDVKNRVRPSSFDVVVTNPPFGANIAIDDPHTLSQFELAQLTTQRRRGSMPPEQLFIERCLYLLKPGGRLAIVLPDSILSNPGLVFIRRWVLQNARIVASIDLPQVTFEPYTGTQTSVMILQKKTEEEKLLEQETQTPNKYETFMALPQAVGHDKRGNPHFLRTPEGNVIEYHEEIPIQRRTASGQVFIEQRRQLRRAIHDELPEVVRYFQEWVGQPERMRWLNE